MIFKIQGDFNEENFSKILNKLSIYFKFIYTNNTLYIALNDIKKKQEASDIMNKVFRPIRSYYIKEVNEKNIMNEEQSIVEWCRDNFVCLDRQRYEIEQQDKLQNAWKALDNMETILQQQILTKNIQNNQYEQKGGENGRRN